jgi:hypothetical protein
VRCHQSVQEYQLLPAFAIPTLFPCPVESSQQRGHSRMWCEKSVNIGKKPHNVDFVLFLIRGKKYRISWEWFGA